MRPSSEDVLPEQLDLIDGVSVAAANSAGVTLCHPDTGQPIGEARSSADVAIERALDSADRLHRCAGWSSLPASDRAAAVLRFADALERVAPQLAVPESVGTGIPIAVTTPMTGGLSGFLRGAAARIERSSSLEMEGRHGRTVLHRLAFGPAVVIAPWNAPSPTIVGKAAAAMAAGCPVIVKPSEWASGTADLIARAAAEAELPAGLFQLVHGGPEVGARLVADRRVRVIAFTGGQPAGRAIAAAAAPNFTRLQLELGGNNPAIVRRDANVAATARSLAAGATKLNGQWCEAPGRVLVDETIADDLRRALLDELESLRIGSCLDQSTVIGPLSHRPLLLRLDATIGRLATQRGVSVDRIGELPALGGWFMQPTVISGLDPTPSLPEMFGPVMTLHAVASDEEALAAANDGEDGLAAYVFSADIERAHAIGASIRAGEIKINGTGLFDLCSDSEQSFWGASGIGGHGDEPIFELFRGSRIVGVDDPDAPI